MSFTKTVILAILTGLILPMAKDYIETNYFHKPSAYEAYHDGGKPSGALAKR